MKRYRCTNCQTEFKAARPACVKCGLDPDQDPRFKAVIVELKTIHFDPPHPVAKGYGRGHRACKPDVKGFRGEMASGHPLAVNCEACRATEAWAQAMAEHGEATIPEDHDEKLTPEPATKG